MKKSKSEFILESIIDTYLSEQSPVGSLVLEEYLSVPASTIRVYFKKLGELGLVDKLHISGGRIPTQKAMMGYWGEFFGMVVDGGAISVHDDVLLQRICHEYEIFCMIKECKNLVLCDIYNLNNMFLVLDFGGSELAMRFDMEIYNLLGRFVGLDVEQLQKFLASVRIQSLSSKIEQMIRSLVLFCANESIVSNLLSKRDFALFDESSYSLDVIDEQMVVRLPCSYQGRSSQMLLAGSVYNDYKKIINIIKEAV